MLTSRSEQLGTLSLYHRNSFLIRYPSTLRIWSLRKIKIGEANAMEEGFLQRIICPQRTSRSNYLRFEMHFHVALLIDGNQLLTFCFMILPKYNKLNYSKWNKWWNFVEIFVDYVVLGTVLCPQWARLSCRKQTSRTCKSIPLWFQKLRYWMLPTCAISGQNGSPGSGASTVDDVHPHPSWQRKVKGRDQKFT